MLKDLLLGYMTAHTFYLHYTLPMDVSIEFLFILKTPLCTLILLQDKPMIMLLLLHVITTQTTLLNLTLILMIKTSIFSALNLLNENLHLCLLLPKLGLQYDLVRLQTPNLELEFEVKVKFQGLNPHPIFHVAKIEHKTTPAPFEVILINFNRDHELHNLAYGKIIFYNPFSGLKYTTSF